MLASNLEFGGPLPFSAGSPKDGAGGSVIRSRRWSLTLIDAGATGADCPSRPDQPVATVAGPAKPFTTKAIHPPAPRGDSCRWRQSLLDTGRWRDAQPLESTTVLAGDFNASSAHPAYGMLAEGMTDAHPATGAGWVRAWPQGSAVPSFIQLDHVLVGGLDVAAAGTDMSSSAPTTRQSGRPSGARDGGPAGQPVSRSARPHERRSTRPCRSR